MKKLTTDFIKFNVEKIEFGYKFLDNYINSRTKHRFICPKNHIFLMTWSDFRRGKRCPQCQDRRFKFSEVRDYITSCGYKLLSNTYINCETKLELECPNYHIYKTTFSNFKHRGRRCTECYKIRMKDRCGIKNPNWKNYSENTIEDIHNYVLAVRQLTTQNYRLHKKLINPENLIRGRNMYHIDHIYSIMDGFRNNILPKIIASPINLRMLSEKSNISKKDKSEFTLEQLNFLYSQFNKGML